MKAQATCGDVLFQSSAQPRGQRSANNNPIANHLQWAYQLLCAIATMATNVWRRCVPDASTMHLVSIFFFPQLVPHTFEDAASFLRAGETFQRLERLHGSRWLCGAGDIWNVWLCGNGPARAVAATARLTRTDRHREHTLLTQCPSMTTQTVSTTVPQRRYFRERTK